MSSIKKRLGLLIALILLSSLVMLPHATVRAQSQTIVVPDNYPTITDALGNATNGEIILVRSGTYNEQTLETNKSISLMGEGSASTIVNLHPPSLPSYILGQFVGNVATAIEFDANNIVISGFTINSYGGMSITGNNEVVTGNIINDYAEYWFTVTGNHETIYNNTSNTVIHACCTHSTICSNSGKGAITVDDFYSSNSFFEGSFNSVFDNNMGSVGGATESCSNLYYGNVVYGGGGMYASVGDIVANNTVTHCSQGVNIEAGSNDIIVDNTITDNSGAALATVGYVEGSLTNVGFNNLIYANYVANNAIGILTDTFNIWHEANYTVYDNNFIDNTQQAQIIVSNSNQTIVSDSNQTIENEIERAWSDHWNYGGHGNYWSDYLSIYPNASEVGSSGIWNTSYYVGGGEQDNYPLVAPFNISSINIQLPSWANITVPNPLLTPSFPSQNLANPQTSPTISTTPTPTAPEFPSLILVLTLFIAVSISIAVKMTARKRKTVE